MLSCELLSVNKQYPYRSLTPTASLSCRVNLVHLLVYRLPVPCFFLVQHFKIIISRSLGTKYETIEPVGVGKSIELVSVEISYDTGSFL